MLLYQQAGKILSEAFFNYPLMLHAFAEQSEAVRAKGLHHLYTHCSKAAVMYGGVKVTPDGQGAVIWLPGGHFPLGVVREIKSGMAAIPFKLGLKATLRLMNHDAEPDSWLKRNASASFGYVWCVGVNIPARGKGYSRLLIEQSIAEMKQKGMDEFWLKTEDPKNVTIYQKLGFETVRHFTVKSSKIPCWVMRKEK